MDDLVEVIGLLLFLSLGIGIVLPIHRLIYQLIARRVAPDDTSTMSAAVHGIVRFDKVIITWAWRTAGASAVLLTVVLLLRSAVSR